jgi:hypothetical protein
MSSQTKVQEGEKREWVKPLLDRLDTRDAESQRGGIPDGGGGFQGS